MSLLFLVLAFVCFVVAALGLAWGRVNFTALGLAFLTLNFLL